MHMHISSDKQYTYDINLLNIIEWISLDEIFVVVIFSLFWKVVNPDNNANSFGCLEFCLYPLL